MPSLPDISRLRAMPRGGWVAGALAVGGLVAFFVWPRSHVLAPARPELLPDEQESEPTPLSMVAAPIRIPLDPLTDLLEDAVPRGYGDIDHRETLPGHDRTELAFELQRAPFVAHVDGDVATIRTTIGYRVRIFYDPPLLPEVSGSCGTGDDEPPPRLTVTLRAPISIDRNWALRTHTRVVSVLPATDTDRDKCTVTFLDLDVTGRIVDAARGFLEKHVEEMDSLAADADVRSSFEGWWRTLQEPIHLTDSLWLMMGPESVRRGPTRGEGDSLEVALALRARPSIAYGPRPDAPHRPLPELDTGGVAEGLDLRVEARAQYGAASDLLSEELGGRVFERDGRRFRVDSLRVFGIGGGRLAVELRVSGDANGRLYLVGTPHIDVATGRVSVPDLDFDLATRDVVVAAAAWLKADEVRDILREKANWPATPAVEFLSRWLAEGLNRELSDDLRVRGAVDSVRILGVRATQDALRVRVSARGSAELFVRDGTGN